MREICYLIALFPLSAIAQSHADFNGEWRGQSQYQATVNGNVDPSAHTVTNITISIAPQGKIVGESPENGCSLLGIAAPGLAPTILNIDVTFSGCHYSAYNRRFSGTLALYPKDQYTALSLTSAQIGIGKVNAMFDIKATLRR